MLEVIRDHFGVTAPRMRHVIQGLHGELIKTLSSKGIKYESLRAALVPVMDRQEAAFIFDSTAFDSGLYGRETFDQVLPLLEPKATQSLLVGDLLGEDGVCQASCRVSLYSTFLLNRLCPGVRLRV